MQMMRFIRSLKKCIMKLRFHENNSYWNPYRVKKMSVPKVSNIPSVQRKNTGKNSGKNVLEASLLFIDWHKYSFRNSIYTKKYLSKDWLIHEKLLISAKGRELCHFLFICHFILWEGYPHQETVTRLNAIPLSVWDRCDTFSA